MRSIPLLTALGLLALGLGAAGPAGAQGTPSSSGFGLDRVLTLSFRRPVEVADILGTIASLCRTNILLDPKVKSKMNLELKDISGRDAIYLVAAINGLKVTEVKNVIVVGQPETIRNVIGKGNVTLRRLAWAKADDIAQLINKVLKDDVDAVSHPPTNTLLMRAK